MSKGPMQQVMVTTTIVPQTTMPPFDNPNYLQLESIARAQKRAEKKQLMWRHKNEWQKV
jgi:hypothetical protein